MYPCLVPVSERAGARVDRDDWDAHWDQYAVAAQHNPAQAYRRRLALRLLERRGAPERLLDIGSGQGDFLAAAAKRWPRAALVGLEASRRGNEIAAEKLPSGRFELVDLAEAAPPASGLGHWASHAVCSEVLEHVDQPAALLRQARRIGHRRHYTPELLRDTFEEAGLLPAATFGAGFPFFNLYRQVVIARGERLADDVSSWDGRPGISARVAMAAFKPLLEISLPRSAWGTQIVGVAREP
jgi:SAM-dependent methyltransferase